MQAKELMPATDDGGYLKSTDTDGKNRIYINSP